MCVFDDEVLREKSMICSVRKYASSTNQSLFSKVFSICEH
jgi:hypothetical protein